MATYEVVWPTAVEEQVTLKLTLVLSDQRHYNAATIHAVEDLGANPHVRNFYARVLDLATRGHAGEAGLSCCEVCTDFSYAGGCVLSSDLARQVSTDGDCDICSGYSVGSAVEPSWDVRRSAVVVHPMPRADAIIGRHVRLVSDSPPRADSRDPSPSSCPMAVDVEDYVDLVSPLMTGPCATSPKCVGSFVSGFFACMVSPSGSFDVSEGHEAPPSLMLRTTPTFPGFTPSDVSRCPILGGGAQSPISHRLRARLGSATVGDDNAPISSRTRRDRSNVARTTGKLPTPPVRRARMGGGKYHDVVLRGRSTWRVVLLYEDGSTREVYYSVWCLKASASDRRCASARKSDIEAERVVDGLSSSSRRRGARRRASAEDRRVAAIERAGEAAAARVGSAEQRCRRRRAAAEDDDVGESVFPW